MPNPAQESIPLTVPRRRRRPGVWLAVAGIGLFFLAFFLYPAFEILRGGLTDEQGCLTFAYMAEIFRNPVYLEGLANTAGLAVCTTLLAALIGVPLAALASRHDFPGKKWVTAGILAPMILPPFVGALGMQKLLGQYGVLNVLLSKLGVVSLAAAPDWLGSGGFWAIVAVEALHLYPIVYLNAVAAFANIDPTLHEAAANLGCTGFRRFRRITLPLVMPGLFAGLTLVFIWSLTELGTPLMFNYGRATPVQIFNGILEMGDNPFPYALVIVLLLASGLLYLLMRFTLGRRAYAMTSRAGTAAQFRPLRGLRGVAAAAAFGGVFLAAVLPHLAIIGLAFAHGWRDTLLPAALTLEHIRNALGHPLAVPSILNSLRYASGALALALLLGVAIAWLTVRVRVAGSWLLDSLAMLPLAVPGLVLAFGYLAMCQKGRLFAFLDPIADPTILLVLAYAVRRLPYVVRAASAGLQQTSVTLEEAGASLGAAPFSVFRRITLPLIAANLVAGAVLAFSFAMLEVSDSLLLAQRADYFPITKAMYELSMLLGEGPALAAALGCWTMLFLGVSLLAASRLLGKQMGALFRV